MATFFRTEHPSPVARRNTHSKPPVSFGHPKPEPDSPVVAHAPITGRPAVLYSRVSSKDQEKEGFSIPAQQRLLREYASEHGFQVVQEFTDVETAKKAGRTNFGKMLSWLRENPSCRSILVEKTDRLYRNLKDWVILDEMGKLEIHLVKEGTILSDDSRSSEKFIHGIKVLMAKNYIDNLSEETRKGMQEKAEQGIWPSTAPIGYRNVVRNDGKHIIEVDADVAPKVASLFELYATGQHPLTALSKLAKKAGLTFRRSGSPLPRGSVHAVLSNPIYMGEFIWKGRRYEGIHQPLVSRDLWEKVQDVLHGRATCCRHEQQRDFALSGLVYCARCASEGVNRLLVGFIKKELYTYYFCARCRDLKRAEYWREEVLEAAVLRSLRILEMDQPVIEWIRMALQLSHADEMKHHAKAIARLQDEYERIQRRLDTAYEDRLDGRITAEFFERKAAVWREEQARTRQEIKVHEQADRSYVDQGIALLELVGKAVQLYQRQDANQRRALLDFLYLNSTWDGETLHVT
jgi:DNA invertase Pin-like site-specific DNA recombinase